MGENKLNTKTSKKSNAQPKLKARFETKVIQDLKTEYEEKIKKAREKENAKIEKFHKDFSMMILENSLNNENFKKEFTNLIQNYDKIKKAYEDLIQIYV